MPTDQPRPWWRPSRPSFVQRFRSRGAQRSEAEDRALVFRLAPSRIPSWKQTKYLPRLLNSRERGWLRFCLTIAGLSVAVLIGHSIARHVTWVPAEGGTLTEGVVGTPQYLNPVLARPLTTDAALTHLLFRGLMRVDERLRVVPDLAQSLTISADGKTYTATLRPNLYWSDGEAVTADDVRYTYETAADASYLSPVQSIFHGVTIATPDKRTIVLTLTEPFEPLRSYLTLGILPAHVWQDQSPQTFPLAELNLKPVGNGPYKFQNITKDRSGAVKGFVFTRNKFFSGPVPKIAKITIKVYPDPISAQEALTSNSIDSLDGIQNGNLNKDEQIRQLQHFAVSELTAVFFNQKNNSALKDKTVRQALGFAVDRQAVITKSFNGVGRVASGPLLPNQPGYVASTAVFDQLHANELLDQAGWKRGENGFRSKGKDQLSFALTTVDDPMYISAANLLATQWKAIGANVTVTAVAADHIQKDTIKPRDYAALLFGQISDIDADPYAFWDSSQQQGSGFALAVGYIKKVDTDVEAARKAVTTEAHDAALRDFQAVVADEVPAIILMQSEDIYAHESNVRGLPTDRIVAPAYRFDSITSWYLKTKLSWK